MQKLLQQLAPLYDRHEAQALLRILVEDVCHESWTRFLAYGLDTPQLHAAVARLAAGEPVQHILGYADFCGHRFRVTPDTLVPRPETEDLVAWVLECAAAMQPSACSATFNGVEDKSNDVDNKFNQAENKFNSVENTPEPSTAKRLSLTDIGTGSGCIAISLAHALPQASITATDISEAALSVARSNDHTGRVVFLQHDILSPTLPLPPQDIIVSNPPYICRSEAAHMHRNVLEHDPHLALFVPDDDPLLFYRAIARHGQKVLKAGGLLLFETNRAYAAETQRLLAQLGYTDIALRHDRYDQPRMVRAKKL